MGFLMVLLAHVLSDFVFQSEATALQKSKGKFGGHLSHAFFVFITTAIFLFPFEGLTPYVLALTVAVVHFLIDYLKYLMNRLFDRFGRDISVASFVFDQILHIVAIMIVVDSFVLVPKAFMDELLSRLPDLDLYIATVIVYVFVVFGGIYFVRVLLDSIPSTQKKEEENSNKGMLIGILERAMILTLWITGSPAAIGFVLTAKSIARFKEFDDKEFAEYYLIGTLSSMLLAVFGGIVLKGIL
jgi:FlaA1/EpsC-like NDP-sugar epimerase